MKSYKIIAITILIVSLSLFLYSFRLPENTTFNSPVPDTSAQTRTAFIPSPIIDYDAFLDLANIVRAYRKNRLISLDTFLSMSKRKNFVILDTRSDSAYNGKHLKGAIHLDFTNFTQEALAELIPDRGTNILIYCNNNFKDFRREPDFFTSKSVRIAPIEMADSVKMKMNLPVSNLSLALNIPTFINLYGYCYRNIYELGEQVFVFDPRLKFEGTAVK